MPAEPAVLERLLRELDNLPTRGTTAVEVLWLVDDPRISSAQLAKVVSGDEALTTRIMRMANASFYGLSGRVSSATFAITVLGFDTVRAVAAAAAAGVMQESMPDWMLQESSLTAAAASLIAPLVGRSASEGTSIGLLHNLGSMLLHRSDRAAHASLVDRSWREGTPLHALEEDHFGAPGHELAAAVLRRWSFPTDFVDALLHQGDPPETVMSPLARVLVAATAVTATILRPDVEEAEHERRQAAMATAHAGPELIDRVREGGAGLYPPIID